MRKGRTLFVALVTTTLVQISGVAGAEDVYAPYRECMARCSTDLSVCMDNISSRAEDKDAQSAACANTNASCTQECQFLPVPGQDEPPQNQQPADTQPPPEPQQ